MTSLRAACLSLGLLGCAEAAPGASAPGGLPVVSDRDLRDPSAFAAIADPALRSQALFTEASRVLTHPRCINCHPSGDVPLQGDRAELHDPPVLRGPDDHGVAGLECTSCHQDRNLELARVPGAPHWALAPRSMAWVGKSTRAICEQLKDPSRNGGKTLAQVVDHTRHDPLVGWGFAPGSGRAPAPGSQARLGALMAAWVETGAVCPSEEDR